MTTRSVRLIATFCALVACASLQALDQAGLQQPAQTGGEYGVYASLGKVVFEPRAVPTGGKWRVESTHLAGRARLLACEPWMKHRSTLMRTFQRQVVKFLRYAHQQLAIRVRATNEPLGAPDSYGPISFQSPFTVRSDTLYRAVRALLDAR